MTNMLFPVPGALKRSAEFLIFRSSPQADVYHQDKKLLDAVSTHGTSWTTIVKSYFSGRTALAAKNR